MSRMFVIVVCALLFAIVAVLAAMIVLGTSDTPRPLASLAKPFESVDFSDLPPVERIPAADRTPIAFRAWHETPPAPELAPVVIAIHGSSATSLTLHPLARALAAQGIPVYAPDIRGHGDTGSRGDIDYAGEIDDDIADFTAAVAARRPNAKLVLLGFSSGGGFALHAAALPVGKMFARAVLLAPMLGVDAPTVNPRQAWAKPFIPRIIAIALLNRIGIHVFDHLSVLAFAIPSDRADFLTGRYSFMLMRAFGTADYVADLRNAAPAISVLVGGKDELFKADKFAPTIAAVRPDIPVTIVPGLGHIEMTTSPEAVPAIAAAVRGADRTR